MINYIRIRRVDFDYDFQRMPATHERRKAKRKADEIRVKNMYMNRKYLLTLVTTLALIIHVLLSFPLPGSWDPAFRGLSTHQSRSCLRAVRRCRWGAGGGRPRTLSLSPDRGAERGAGAGRPGPPGPVSRDGRAATRPRPPRPAVGSSGTQCHQHPAAQGLKRQ